jgi:hypothetical protein
MDKPPEKNNQRTSLRTLREQSPKKKPDDVSIDIDPATALVVIVIILLLPLLLAGFFSH